MKLKITRPLRSRGFALVITLSLMILLTVIAVGLLTLSTVSLRSSSQGDAMQVARANARVALMLAIGEVQRTTGPDQRITIPADQRKSGADGKKSSAAPENIHWTGVFKSWPDTSTTRPTPEFQAWLVSGVPDQIRKENLPDTATGNNAVELVGTGTLGSTSTGQVKVPSLSVLQNKKPARLAYWVGDQGLKATLVTPPLSTDKTSLGVVRGNLQSAPRNAVEIASTGTLKPFENLAADDVRLPLVTDWRQTELLASDTSAPRGLFHDLAAHSSGLLTNVAAGGFRRDLSLQLERPLSNNKTPLYTVGGKNGINLENGINLGELWVYYNAYKNIIDSGSYTFTTGGLLPPKTPYMMVGAVAGPDKTTPKPTATASDCAGDDFFFLKQPAIIRYQMVLAFRSKSLGPDTARLELVSYPIITLWNPLDIPLVIPTGTFISVKYWQIPYDIRVKVNSNAPIIAPLAASLSGSTATAERDQNFISIQIGTSTGGQMVFKPGEVIKFSQSGGIIERDGGAGGKNDLVAKKGFNLKGGYSMPLKDRDGKTIVIKKGDEITYEAYPNNLTAGRKNGSGNTFTGNDAHSRHFSLTHHEVYVGRDRDELPTSLGYGNMSLDWDFGNERLKPGKVRGANDLGTKPKNARLAANNFPAIFRPLTTADAIPLSYSRLLTEIPSPFLLLSYDAKTEYGTETATRFLSRFNPKAHHVDFYDLSQTERDILSYEFRAEPLVSWSNRSLDQSPDGEGFFGGGMTTENGTGIITTHSIPREPPVSLAAFQHSFANGFEFQRPTAGYASINSREPLLPQISHAIGNSLAPPMIAADQTEGTLVNRPMADHSFLANRALWDDWCLSGVATQRNTSFSQTKSQKALATEFFSGQTELPVVRYIADTDGEDPQSLVTSFFTGTAANATGISNLTSYLRVDGLFNVNSTSVEAWKSVLGSLKGRPIVVRDAVGRESIAPAGGNCPVVGLHHPIDLVADGSGSLDIKDPAQWGGRRELSDPEIQQLAEAIVVQIRLRGPFLSLADFVNRRLGNDQELAKAGAIQCALDSSDVDINKAFTGSRSVGSAKDRFVFPKAEEGPLAYGIPGHIKQADILTPIAPVLSARSDSFIIRAYGESVDGAGKITARAWCEAVVERDRNFVDPADEATTAINSLSSETNLQFGRRYEIISFRWLSTSEV